MIALRQAQRAGLLQPDQWLPNVVAGVVVGVVALPLSMAFAIASGAKPEQGVYTAIIAGLLVSSLGGSLVQIAGPTGAFVVVLAGITAKYGIGGMQLASLMAGFILLAMGLAKLGGVIKFIPAPVIVGFTAGIGVIIWIGQWQAFFGLPAPHGEHTHEKLASLVRSLPQLSVPTTLLSLLCVGLVLLAPRVPPLRRVPGPLVAMVAATVIQTLFDLPGVATIGTAFGGIPSGLPRLQPPEASPGLVIALIGPAFTIAMLGAIESLLSAVVADGMIGARHDSNQELVGQGIANLASAAFGGFAATGAIARTATNIRNGGRSPIAGIVHSLTLVLTVVLLAPLAANIPLAVLAAILWVVAWNMSDARHFLRMVRIAPRADVAILLVTFLLTVFSDLVIAVNVGVVLAMLNLLRRMASSVEVRQQGDAELAADPLRGSVTLPGGAMVFAIDGPFFFAAAETFEQALGQTHTDPETLILRLGRVPFVDITGMQALHGMIEHLSGRGVRVIVCEANPRVRNKLFRAGILDALGPENYAPDLAGAIALSAGDGTLARQEAALEHEQFAHLPYDETGEAPAGRPAAT